MLLILSILNTCRVISKNDIDSFLNRFRPHICSEEYTA